MGLKLQVNFLFHVVVVLFGLEEISTTRAQQHYNGSRSHLSGKCNLFEGKWVFDASYPLYDSSACPFIDSEFNCLKFGRPDKHYLKFSWQPHSCALPRFNGVEFMRRMRGKKIMFVGDSLSLNMWESLSCILHASLPNPKSTSLKGEFVTFHEYGVSLIYYRTPYLVDIVRERVGNVLKLNSIDGGSNLWKTMDVLIFNSWHWWTHTGNSRAWDYVYDGKAMLKDMNRLDAFEKGMSTWARWVDLNVNPSKTKVFFQGISPTHYEGREWNQPKKNCHGQTFPLSGSTYPGGAPAAAAVLHQVLATLHKPVYLLDITTLSQLRKDAHPSSYGDGSGTDCSHWCLPGLPDTWNQLLYAALIAL